MEEISQENFYNWKHHPVTLALLAKYEWVKNNIINDMISEDTIRNNDARAILHERLGALTQIEDFLHPEYNDLFIPNEGIKNVNII